MVDGLPAAVDPDDAVQAGAAAHENHGVPGAGTDQVAYCAPIPDSVV